MLFLDNNPHPLPDLPNTTVFDTAAALRQFYYYMDMVVYWLQHTFFTFPASFVNNGAVWYISYWDLFFSGWAVLMIISWIPEIGPEVAAAGDDSDGDSDDYIFF